MAAAFVTLITPSNLGRSDQLEKGILLERVAFHNVIITSILIYLDIFTDGIKVKEGVRFFKIWNFPANFLSTIVILIQAHVTLNPIK